MEGQSLRLPVPARAWERSSTRLAAMEGQSLRLPVLVTAERAARQLHGRNGGAVVKTARYRTPQHRPPMADRAAMEGQSLRLPVEGVDGQRDVPGEAAMEGQSLRLPVFSPRPPLGVESRPQWRGSR